MENSQTMPVVLDLLHSIAKRPIQHFIKGNFD